MRDPVGYVPSWVGVGDQPWTPSDQRSDEDIVHEIRGLENDAAFRELQAATAERVARALEGYAREAEADALSAARDGESSQRIVAARQEAMRARQQALLARDRANALAQEIRDRANRVAALRAVLAARARAAFIAADAGGSGGDMSPYGGFGDSGWEPASMSTQRTRTGTVTSEQRDPVGGGWISDSAPGGPSGGGGGGSQHDDGETTEVNGIGYWPPGYVPSWR